jgi:hypothetical protein
MGIYVNNPQPQNAINIPMNIRGLGQQRGNPLQDDGVGFLRVSPSREEIKDHQHQFTFQCLFHLIRIDAEFQANHEAQNQLHGMSHK